MNPFNSCIYSGFVTHRRFKPKRHFFAYKTFSLLIDLNEIKNDIISIDFVESAQISQILPNSLIIEIIESQPVILVTLNNENFLMDENGHILHTNKESISYFAVPIINITENIAGSLNLRLCIQQVMK